MKTSKPLRYFYRLFLLAGCLGYASAAPYGPDGRQINWVQPSGEKLTLRVFGDDFYARTETSDGYTVAYNSDDGAYYYANLSPDSSALIPSVVMADQPAPDGFKKHLDLPKKEVRAKSNARREQMVKPRMEMWKERVQAYNALRWADAGGEPAKGINAAQAKVKAAPVVGAKKGLTILIQFPKDSDSSAVDFPTTRDKIIRFCNKDGYDEDGNSGSVRDFYFDQSGGKLTYTQTVTQIVTLPHPRNYYNYSNYPKNTVFRQDSGDRLLEDSIAELKKADFDFSSLTTDVAGNAIATNMFFAGPDSGSWAQGLWPMQTYFTARTNVGTGSDPIYIYGYQMTNIEDASPVIGTFCHENGHLLMGYSDLYDYDGDSRGVGDHCLMGGGNYNNGGKTPSPLNAYFKDVAGWENVTDLDVSAYKTATLRSTGNSAYRFSKPGEGNEFFIVENRGDGDKWAQYSKDKGIAIWHVDTSIDGDNDQQMTSTNHYQVSLEQADGLFQLERDTNNGDSSDLFDLQKSKFTDSTIPNAKWWDGTKSGLVVQVVSATSSSIRTTFGALPPDNILIESPNGGEVVYPLSTFTVKWEANITGNVNIDLYKGGTYLGVIAANEPNDGVYDWEVPVSVGTGSGYTIRISSIINSVPAVDSSDGPFTITSQTFPPLGVMPIGWYTPGSADGGWKVSKDEVFEGKRSVKSSPIGDGKTAAVAYRSDFKDGYLTFYMKVISEKGFDYATFSIDGVNKPLTRSGVKKLSGRSGWVFQSYPISAGKHTFQWSYQKDDSYGTGADAAWIDGLLMPATTQEIVVQKPVGNSLISGDAKAHFSPVTTGESSAPQTFTIKNVGNADLTGLKVKTIGSDAGEFAVGSLGKSLLAPGASTTFNVRFKPNSLGFKKADLVILSNDEDESPFRITLSGTGLGLPEIAVFQPSDHRLKDEADLVSFGHAVVNTSGRTKIFTVKNTGTAILKGLSIEKAGQNPGNFKVSSIGKMELAPGESTTFKITFVPSKVGDRSALIAILSNDKIAGNFDLKLAGKGAPKQLAARLSGSFASTSGEGLFDAVFGSDGLQETAGLPSVTSVEVIDGDKYMALTVTKDGTSSSPLVVEVSSNLLDWYSGKNHTTTLVDDETTLKVRDNTPVTPDAKRYIQLKAD